MPRSKAADHADHTPVTGAGDQRRTTELLWGSQEPRNRGPRPGLSVDAIASAAIAIADEGGVAALSMRTVAERLGVTTMALYRYVPGKAELLDLMLDRVMVGFATDEAGDWRSRLDQYVHQEWEFAMAHPWVLQVASSRPPLGPNVLDAYESSLRTLDGTGLSGAERTEVVELVVHYVQGAARSAINARQVQLQSGTTDEEWWQAHGGMMAELMAGERYRAIAQCWNEGGLEEADAFKRAGQSFLFGLQRLLDGVEALVVARSGQREVSG